MKKLLFTCGLLLATTLIFAQTAAPTKKDTLAWFDFWAGNWDLHWFEKDSVKAFGENIITKDLDGVVITENFKALTGQNKDYKGCSLSVFDNRTQSWRQTWVDNTNTYLPFVGGKEGNTPFFEQRFTGRNGNSIIQKMFFKDITPNSFIWDWKASSDGGQTWVSNWQIFYQRKKANKN